MAIDTAEAPLAGAPAKGAPRILMIGDRSTMSAATQLGLRRHGFAVDASDSGFEGEDLAASGEYDLIVLDVLVADRDGAELCRNLRRRRTGAKVLILAADCSTGEIVKGLDSGADDCLTKPFDFEELLARIRALLRRGDIAPSRVLRCDDLVLDLYTHRARRGDRTIKFSNREFALLEFLMRNQDHVVSRARIGEKVWGTTAKASDNVVNVYVSMLRKKVDRGGGPELIHTLNGAGYRFGIADGARPGTMNGEPARAMTDPLDADG